MKIPQLYDWAHPDAPQWASVGLTPAEVDELCETLVMFVGHDTRPGAARSCVPLGSGFIVGVLADTLVVLSAAHIFSWWIDQVVPPSRHALRGVLGDPEDMKVRLQKAVMDDKIAAGVHPRGRIAGCFVPIVGVSFNPDPRDMDVAVIQLALPKGMSAADFRILPIDADPFDFQEPVVMAGFVDGGRAFPKDGPFEAGLYEQKIMARAGRVGEYVERPDGSKSPLYRVNIRSEPGMSGGPLILLRGPTSHGVSNEFATAIGVVSRDRLTTPILLNHCDSGETWVSPIASALCRKVGTTQGVITVSHAVKQDLIPSFGYVARAAVWTRDPISGCMTPSLPAD
jgi:hypothetical protein